MSKELQGKNQPGKNVGELYAEVNGAGSFTIIDRLLSSFTELESAIASAKSTLRAKDNVPEEVFERLGSYDGILA